MIFSLFYGMWRDTTSPTCNVSKKITQQSSQYWIHIVSYLCRLYDLPPPIQMWELDIPGKNHWNKFLHETMDRYWRPKLTARLEEMKIHRFIGQNDLEYKKAPKLTKYAEQRNQRGRNSDKNPVWRVSHRGKPRVH